MARRERSINWENEEKQLLREIINPYMKIIENKDISTNVNKDKLNAWTEITEQFNCANKRPREKKQLVTQWKLIKLKAKKEVTKYKKESSRTGGGPKPPSPCPETQEIVQMIPQEFEVDFNEFDCDGKQGFSVKLDDNVNTLLVNEKFCQPSTSQIEPVVVIDENSSVPPLRVSSPVATRKCSGKKRMFSQGSKGFDFGKASYEDMKKFREIESERHQAEHELRLKHMAEFHDQVMFNLKLQEKILLKVLEKENK